MIVVAIDKNSVIPFGKYKGRLVEEVLTDDPGYLQWLSGQDWFRGKYVNLYQVVINRGAEPEETPEHNALQVLFLEDNFCLKFFHSISRIKRSIDEGTKELPAILAQINSDISTIESKPRNEFHGIKNWRRTDAEEKMLSDLRVRAGGIEAEMKSRKFRIINRQFELKGVDVKFTVEGFLKSVTLCVEIKPAVGDDYPAVLRQMRAKGNFPYHVLFLERYSGTGATEEQFIKTFNSAGISVVFLRDIR